MTYLTSSSVLLLLGLLPCCNSSTIKNPLIATVVSRYETPPLRTMQYPYPRKPRSNIYIFNHHVLCAIQPIPPLATTSSPFPSPPSLPTTPPLLPTPKPHQPLRPNAIPILQQIRYIEIKRRIHLRVREQLVDSFERGNERVGR